MKRQITKSFWADDETRRAQHRLILPLQLIGAVERGAQPEAKPLTGQASQFLDMTVPVGAADQISPLPLDQILPQESDLFFVNMRAVSMSLLEGHWVDYRKPGVLEAAVPLFPRQRICVDHEYRKAEDAIGAIVSANWDKDGANSNGVPGINVRFFVDARIAPGIVRRLAYPVPAIHSGSVTIGFEWEPSHLHLLEERKFWSFLGENVDGEIVRLIATKILFAYEYSLVWEGADPDAKRLPDGELGEDDDEMKRKDMQSASQTKPPEGGTTNEVKTVKLNAEQKKLLKLESHTADEVPDAEVVAAIQSFGPRLTAAQAIIDADRAEVLRLATLAEGTEGKLNDALSGLIQNAAPEQLPGLKTLYGEKAQSKFPATCQKCGASHVAGRSSVEEPPTPPAVAQQQAAEPPRMSFL